MGFLFSFGATFLFSFSFQKFSKNLVSPYIVDVVVDIYIYYGNIFYIKIADDNSIKNQSFLFYHFNKEYFQFFN